MNATTTLGLVMAGLCAGAVCYSADTESGREKPPVEAIPAYKTAPIKVDGALDDPAWQVARRIPIKYVRGKKDRVATDVVGEFMLAWDEHYLYVGYLYTSSVVPVSRATGQQVGPSDNQRAMLSIEGGRSHIFELNIDLCADGFLVWELHHSAQNYWLAKLCVRPRNDKDPLWNVIGNRGCPVLFTIDGPGCNLLKDDGECKLKTVVQEIWKEVDGQKQYAGYTTEWAVPLTGISALIERRGPNGAYQLDGHRFRAFGGEWRMEGAEDPFYHSVPGSDKGWFVDVLLDGHIWEFKGAGK